MREQPWGHGAMVEWQGDDEGDTLLTTARITDEKLAAMARALAVRLNRLADISDEHRRPPAARPGGPAGPPRPR